MVNSFVRALKYIKHHLLSFKGTTGELGIKAIFFVVCLHSSYALSQDATASLNNGNLRFGNGTNGSVNTYGNLNQPWYMSDAWYKLTYSNNPLDIAIGLAGDGTEQWNTTGTIVSNVTLTDQVIDTSAFVATTDNSGYGVITTTGSLSIGGADITLQHRYELAETSRFLRVTTQITNTSASTISNVRVWLGTRDDWIGNTDGPTKTRGAIANGEFNAIANAGDFSDAIQITSGAEGVLFYSSSSQVSTIQNYCCSFNNVTTLNPATSSISASGDGSYGIFVRMSDLAAGESDTFDWYYAAGAIADFSDIIAEVAAAASVAKTIEEDTVASFSSADFQDADNNVYERIRIVTLPDAAKGQLLLSGAPISVDDEVLSSDYANITYQPVANFNGTDVFVWQAWNADTSSYLSDSNVNISVSPVNDAPELDSAVSFSVNEGALAVHTVNATDVEDDALTFTVTGGEDAALFAIDASTGTLSFLSAPDFESPSDNNLDNVYQVEVTVTDNGSPSLSTSESLQITVNDVNDVPEVTSETYFAIMEGGTAIGITIGQDQDGDSLTYSVVGGADAGRFTIDAQSGTLRFTEPPSYGLPGDQDGNNTYEITIQVDDGRGGIATQNIDVAVTENAQPVTVPQTLTINEDTTTTINVLDSDYDPDGDTLSIVSAVTDRGEIRVESDSIIWTPALNFNGSQVIDYVISDGLANTAGTIDVTVTPVNDAPVAVNDIVVTFSDTAVVIAVLANDYDVEDETLSVVDASASNGTVTVNADNTLTFTPESGLEGRTSIDYTMTDGALTARASVEAIVNRNITILPNVAPLAETDNFQLTSWDQQILDVLANDVDEDGDMINLISASAEVGDVQISENQITFIPLVGQTGFVVIDYAIADSEGNVSHGIANVSFDIVEAAMRPTIDVPADLCDGLVVQATALYSRVDIGVSSAEDRFGNPLPVSLTRGAPLFPPGNSIAYWTATDAEGNTTVAPQWVCVEPLVSLGKDQGVLAEDTVEVAFYLNGEAPSYPVVIPYTVSGTASSADHDLVDGEVIIESGTAARVRFNTFANVSSDDQATVVVTLDPTLNLGAKSSQTITISNDNVAPYVELNVLQGEQQRMLVSRNGGEVSVVADVTDPNIGDTFSFDWQSDDASLVDIASQSNNFVFEPSTIESGIYTVTLTVTDSGSNALAVTNSVNIHVVDSLPTLTNLDSDGDGISDNIEGFVDSDKDGIADYLDRNNECNVLNQTTASQSDYLIEGEAGVCLRKGLQTLRGESGGALLLDNDISEARISLPADNAAINVGGIFDFVAYGLPGINETTAIVLPQRSPVPVNAVYRKYSAQNGWNDFVENNNNSLWSTAGEPGFCPPAGSDLWQPGLGEGHWCVQLNIEDGGPNDDDGIANGTVVDPGYVGVLDNGNALPVASDATITIDSGTESVIIDALAYVSDADGDALALSSASVNYGAVSIVDNEIVFTPLSGYGADTTIYYGVSDGNGGTAAGSITVSVRANQAPTHLAIADITINQGEATPAINILAVVRDAEGDTLALERTEALNGTVTTSSDDTVVYTPNPDFSGEDIVTYSVTDSVGNRSEGTFTVIVIPYQQISAKTETSGGSMSLFWLLSVLAIVIVRRSKAFGTRPEAALLMLLCVGTAFPATKSYADEHSIKWYVAGDLGKAETSVSSNDLDIAFAQNGIMASSTGMDASDVSWTLSAGIEINRFVNLELGYRDLGERALWFEGQTNYPDAYFEAAEDVFPESGDGLVATLILSFPITDQVKLSARAGVFDWNSNYKTINEDRWRAGDEIDGTSFVYGAEVSYRFSERFQGYAGVERTDLDKQSVSNYLLGLRYYFSAN